MDTVCDTFIIDLYWLAMSLVIHSVGMFWGSLFLFCAGFRFAHVFTKRDKKK